MSVNITVNGKFAKHCTRQSVLDDPEYVKKELERDRRKQRLLQVREEANNIARKLRNDVAEEKNRQLKNLENIKAQELNCWREHVLAHKNHDYRSAIFQVGSAHYAAKVENEQRAAKKKTASYKDFQKQIAARRSCRKSENQQNKANTLPESCGAKRTCAQTVICHQENKKHSKPLKSKRKICVHEKSLCCCSSDSEEHSSSNCDSSSVSSCSETDVDIATKCTQTDIRGPPLHQTPAVILDVEVASNDSVTITTPCEIKDKHVQNNRQFSHVVRISPRKNKKLTENQTKTPQKTHSKLAKPSAAAVKTKDDSIPKGSKIEATAKDKQNKPHFTQISDLLQKKNNTPRESAVKSTPRLHSNVENEHVPKPTSTNVTSAKSPRKSTTTTTSSDVTTFCGTIPAVESATTTSASGSSGRVQFYDYNNKFAKEYPQPVNSVNIRPHDPSQPTAMEQANIDRQQREQREQEAEELRKRAEERGRKALERERIRRDCTELTNKLDALTQENPNLIPNDTHLTSYYRIADRAKRREQKMTSAIEELLSRPAIITCPEVENTEKDSTSKKHSTPQVPTSINLGDIPENTEANNASSSNSCCSILLGYVDDQKKQVRDDLSQCEMQKTQSQQSKAEHLKNLLTRIEEMRQCLLKELENEEAAANSEKMQNVLDSISELRKERENILIGDDKGISEPLEDREKELQRKEQLFEQKLREICRMQNEPIGKSATKETTKTGKSTAGQIIQKSAGKPVEIIIKLKNDTKCKSHGQHGKLKMKSSKSPRKLSTLIQNSAGKKTPKKKLSMSNIKQKTPKDEIKRHNSYDSNSTSYRSLPTTIANKVDGLLEKVVAPQEEDQNDKVASKTARPKPPRLNPLIAHYIQRLLGMSRNSVNALGVSSSTIDTPSTSVINTSANKSNSTSSSDELAQLSQERLERVQQFIEENRSFVNELEETLRSQSNLSLEASVRMLEEIWQQRLRNKKPATKNVSRKLATNLAGRAKLTQNKPQEHHKTQNDSATKTRKSFQKEETMAGSKQEIITDKSHQREKRHIDRAPMKDKSVETLQQDSDAEAQIMRYAQLTDNCTQRIAELTELINKVREEKQRLLEVTLSSVSENGRNSTEYLDLPENKGRVRVSSDRSSGADASESKLLDSNIVNEQADVITAESMPLEKHKSIGLSRDSGISMSRPLTAQEQHPDAEPTSVASSHTHSSNAQRKVKPPPTLRRFSPQLLEDELVHELSTILEVDTPATSRVNNSAHLTAGRSAQPADSMPSASRFPTFEQYVQELGLDLSVLNQDQQFRMHQEFNELIVTLKKAEKNNVLNYEEFPSLSSYMANLTAHYREDERQEHSPETVEDLIANLRLANLTVKSFPTQREYMTQLLRNNPERELIDTESLDNITSGAQPLTETDSESINIEEELKRRNILQSSFRSCAAAKEQIFSSSTHSSSGQTTAAIRAAQMFVTESGIEKISTSDNFSGDIERDLFEVGVKWPATMRRKTKEREALSSSTSTSVPLNSRSAQNTARQERRVSIEQTDSCYEFAGHPLNLRDFLTKELLKHANTSCSSSSTSDDSLRSQFFRSIIGSITPSYTPRTKTNGTSGQGGSNLDRQKTSTPVFCAPQHSSNASSSSTTTQLFSGESRISSVRFQDRSSVHYYCNDNVDENDNNRR